MITSTTRTPLPPARARKLLGKDCLLSFLLLVCLASSLCLLFILLFYPAHVVLLLLAPFFQFFVLEVVVVCGCGGNHRAKKATVSRSRNGQRTNKPYIRKVFFDLVSCIRHLVSCSNHHDDGATIIMK